MNRKAAHVAWPVIVLSAVLVLSMVIGQRQAQAQTLPSGQRLRNLAGSFLIGYASRSGFTNMSDSAQYQTVAAREFNIITPENDMKWSVLRPNQNTFNFGPADQHVNFGRANNMVIHGHTLVWHSQNPNWFSNPQSAGLPAWNATTLTNAYNTHIDTVVNRYENDIAVWDVVNEAFEENGNLRNAFPWNIAGRGLIEQAFRRARAADPDAILLYNDFNIEPLNAKSNAVFSMAQDFVNRGVPIDGIGFQMHLTSGGIDNNSLRSNIQRFANLGLDIYITEMDVRYSTPISQANLNAQATIYQNVLDACMDSPACKALQVWGIPDKYSWVPETFPGTGAALIFDDNYNAKPAYFSIQTRLGQNNNPTNTPIGPTATRTPTPIGPTATRTPTPIGPTATRTPTPIGPTATPGAGACSPVSSTISAPFSFDGAGTFCWQSSNLGSFVNSWNMVSVTINGVDFTNRWASSNTYPARINGFYFVRYQGNFPWSHFEAR